MSSLFIIGLANTFALVATFTFNNVEDIVEDIHAPSHKNFIALGKVSKRLGCLIAAIAAVVSISLSFFAGNIVFLLILAILAIGFLYSWRPFRIKTMPFWDVFSNGVAGGLMFLSSAWSSPKGIIFEIHLFSVCAVFFLGTALSLIVHQLYDYEDDLIIKIKTSVTTIGKKKAYWVVGCIMFTMGCLLAYECWTGFFSIKLILSYCIVSGGIIAISLIFLRKKSTLLSKCLVPWAINMGAVTAILAWYYDN